METNDFQHAPGFDVPLTEAAPPDQTLRELDALPADADAPEGIQPIPRTLRSGDAGLCEYRLAHRLGSGGMGEVFAVLHHPTDRLVAVKVALEGDGSPLGNRLLWEAQTTAKLEHPGIVPVYDIGFVADAASDDEQSSRLTGGLPFYVMRMLPPGRTWDREMPCLPLRDNVEILLRAADAVRYAHSRGVLHLDLKPANVMLGDFGEVLLMDWGLAVSLEDGDGRCDLARPLRRLDAVPAGTPAYASPEQARGDVERIGVETDVYLLGAVLFEIIAGSPPHGSGPPERLRHLAAENRIEKTETPPEYMELKDIADKALSSEPERRHQDVLAFQEELRTWLRRSEGLVLLTHARNELDAACGLARNPTPVPVHVYAAFEKAKSLLAAAGDLLPPSDGVDECARELAERHAQFALSRDDLDLAEASLGIAGETPAAVALHSEIEARRRLRGLRARRAHRYAWVLAVGAVVTLIALGAIAVEERRIRYTLSQLADRLFVNAVNARTVGHDSEAETGFSEALRIFERLNRDPTPAKVALADLIGPEAPSKRFMPLLDFAASGGQPVQAWAFPPGGERAAALGQSGAAGMDTSAGVPLWRWTAPDFETGRWHVSPRGLAALFVPHSADSPLRVLDINTGNIVASGRVDGMDGFSSTRFAVADDGGCWLLSGRDSEGKSQTTVFESTPEGLSSARLEEDIAPDAAVFLDSGTLILSFPGGAIKNGRHVLRRRGDGDWLRREPFGERRGNAIQGTLLSQDGLTLNISYARPPVMLGPGTVSEADSTAGEGEYFPAGMMEEWGFDNGLPRLTGRGLRFPDSQMAGFGRWLDRSNRGKEWPKDILFNVNAADGLVALLRLETAGSIPIVRRTLTSKDYRRHGDKSYVVTGRIVSGDDMFQLGLSDGSLLVYSAKIRERLRRFPLALLNRDGFGSTRYGLAAATSSVRLAATNSRGAFAIVDGSDGKIVSVKKPAPDQASRVGAEHFLLTMLTGNGAFAPRPPVAISAAGEAAAAALGDTVEYWEEEGSEAGGKFATLPPCPEIPLGLHVERPRTIVAFAAGAAYRYDGSVWHRLFLMPNQPDEKTLPHPFSLSKDGSRLARLVTKTTPEALFDGADNYVEAWDLLAGKKLWRTPVKGLVSALAWSRDNARIAVGHIGGRGVLALRGKDGSREAMLMLLDAIGVTQLDFSGDGAFLAALTSGGQIRIWHTADWLECLRRPRIASAPDAERGNTIPGIAMQFLFNGKLSILDADESEASASNDRRARFFAEENDDASGTVVAVWDFNI